MKRIIIFENNQYEEFALVNKFSIGDVSVILNNNKVYVEKNNQVEEIELQTKYLINNKKFVVLENEFTQYKNTNEIMFISNSNADINVKDVKIVIENNKLTKSDDDVLYVNSIMMTTNKVVLHDGDRLLLPGYVELIWNSEFISICGDSSSFNTKLNEKISSKVNINKLEYKRSPRIVKRFLDDKVTINKISEKIEGSKNSLLKVVVPPVVMASGTVASSIIMGRGMFVIFGVGATLVTTTFSITSYFSEKKSNKFQNKQRILAYEKHLLATRNKLHALNKNEIDAINYNFPSIENILKMINQTNSRIYERDANDGDFLTLNVGCRNERANYSIEFEHDPMALNVDDLTKEAISLVDEFKNIDNKPVTIDLKNSHLGIVGEKHEIHDQIKRLVSQLTFFHSYHDLQMVFLFNEEYLNEFDYFKWYPHFKLRHANLSGNIYNERIRDQVIGSLYQVIKDRKNKLDDGKKDIRFSPHYVIIVDDYSLIVNHPIMEYLQSSGSGLGFSLIFTAQKRYNLPENIHSVMAMKDMLNATLVLNEKVEVNKNVEVNSIKHLDFEKSARSLNALKHQKTLKSQIPDKVSFLDLYGVNFPEELNIVSRWSSAQSHKSLAVPLGFRATDDLVYLNLHERAHGPHGLVAGTTGSGKSEVIQSYILSLATNFSPHEVGFLLIDYKGGGMANLFKKLPHLLGTITNLDGSESMRALSSIKAELKRRQEIFNENNVNNINLYNNLFKEGKATEPLPHLFIISDEFAELKKEQPEFMSELVSVARIGRTLGVHLILATQKPTGVVDDQIWSNSKFKLALKVQNESDSKEILKTPDAAFITKAGRAYLQVGNNEIYELFQSAWSGAPFVQQSEEDVIDNRIYKINSIGQGELINKDLSDIKDEKTNTITQLDAVVNYIEGEHLKMNLQTVRKTWLPNLESRIFSPYFSNIIDVNEVNEIETTIKIGLVDVPERQEQVEHVIDFNKSGNLAVYAGSGQGKSTTLTTIIMSLAIKNNPELLNIYIFDFGNSALVPLKQLPQVADYMAFSDVEKIEKAIELIYDEFKRRKKLFLEKMVQNFEVYNKTFSDEKLSAMFIVIDNFDVVGELGLDFEAFITKLSRDGGSLGMFTIISATRENALRFATKSNFNNNIVLNLSDPNEINNLIGRSSYELNSKEKGRALIKNEIISKMQIYLAVDSNNDFEYNENLKNLINDITSKYSGKKLRAIAVLPDEFTNKDFDSYDNLTDGKNLIGLSADKVKNISAPLNDSKFLIIGNTRGGKTNVLKLLLSQMKEKVFLFDSDNLDLNEFSNDENVNYIINESQIVASIDAIKDIIETRKAEFNAGIEANLYKNRNEFLKTLEPVYCVIDEVDEFINKTANYNTKIAELMTQSKNSKITWICTVHPSKFSQFDSITKELKLANYALVIGEAEGLNIFNKTISEKVKLPLGYVYDGGEKTLIKIPEYVGK